MLVSVIIPCFNVELFISECLDSVLAQTHTNTEIICVDNNSTDDTLQLLNNYQERFPQKITILQEKKKGASSARNKGISIAKGEWFQFLDADDLLLPEKIKTQIEIAITKKDIGFIAASSKKLKVDLKLSIDNPFIDDPFKGIFTTALGNTCANLFNAKSIKSISGWDESIKSSQEYDLMFRLLKSNAEIAYDSNPLTVIRERASGQISQGNPKTRWIRYIELRLTIINYLKKNKTIYFEANKDFYEQFLFSNIRTLAKYDLVAAIKLFNDNFEKTFVPKISAASTKSYIVLYQLVGFKLTEKIKSYMK